ncbi:hypothetical protein FC682_17920 [Peribacillus simplex]|uniref:riboflavin kinase n=1 Tax=Peribacillus simplex TaxID=1478 RepID=UPI0010BEB28B|nr:riboflavin kinase [Peribacillus simplex]TKH03443.1 hypothetical protein FC682_17920 [Peribacillus simplex]
MTFTGVVVHSKKLGRTINFPTANLEPTNPKFTMTKGVYVVFIYFKGKQHIGVMNIVNCPTIKGLHLSTNNALSIEIHILDFEQDIYGYYLKVEPVTFLREEKKFNSLEELKRQITRDVKMTREIFGANYTQRI